jgi:hypothetical protein
VREKGKHETGQQGNRVRVVTSYARQRLTGDARLVTEAEFALIPTCPRGWTREDLTWLFSPGALADFSQWMAGQTCAVCDGQSGKWIMALSDECDHEPTQEPWALDPPCFRDKYMGFEKSDSPCKGDVHGVVVYEHDVFRYLESDNYRGNDNTAWD